jgi:predicted tellurium resistance membrane protein TerC
VNEHPSIQILGLSFLILIGFMLMTEAAHLAHLKVFDTEIGTIPKGYLYFAIFFSLIVEFLNMRVKKKQKPIQLHGLGEEAKKEGLID